MEVVIVRYVNKTFNYVFLFYAQHKLFWRFYIFNWRQDFLLVLSTKIIEHLNIRVRIRVMVEVRFRVKVRVDQMTVPKESPCQIGKLVHI